MEKRINTVFGLYMKGDMMIEFNGYLTGVSQKFFANELSGFNNYGWVPL